MVPGGILFLDLSTSVGWAYGRAGDSMPQWGVWQLPGEMGTDEILNSFENIFLDALDEMNPVRVGVEAPIPQRDNNVRTAEITYGLHTLVRVRCLQAGLPLSRPTADRIRAAVAGRAKRTEAEKTAKISVKNAIVLPWCVSMGWEAITDHNARDAAAGWAYETGIRFKKEKPPRKI